jgi:hypothetical protein
MLICRGHIPVWKKSINSDSAKFLAYFRPKGKSLDIDTARTIVRYLHLAFKGMDGGEVYDVLMQQFLMAAAKYDPDYIGKVKQVVEVIQRELSKYREIRVVDVGRYVEFDCDRHLRMLDRRGFLQAVKGKDGKISGWVRSGSWPPPAGFIKTERFGFTNYIQTWFRYYLQQWIEKRQGELETKEGVYSFELRGGKIPDSRLLRAGNIDGTFLRETADSEEVADPHGKHRVDPNDYAEDSLRKRQIDLSQLNIEWVELRRSALPVRRNSP